VQQQARENNFIRLADLTEGAIYEWILRSGFTQEEVTMIQAPFYMPPQREMPNITEKDRLHALYNGIMQLLRSEPDRSLQMATERLLAYRLAHA
jgi:hypothetical protein